MGVMSKRHAVRVRKIPVSVTLTPEDYDFIEMLINSRRYSTRVQVIERALQLLRLEFEQYQAYLAQQGNQQHRQQGQPPSHNSPDRRFR